MSCPRGVGRSERPRGFLHAARSFPGGSDGARAPGAGAGIDRAAPGSGRREACEACPERPGLPPWPLWASACPRWGGRVLPAGARRALLYSGLPGRPLQPPLRPGRRAGRRGRRGPASADRGTVDLREMLAVSVLAAVRGGEEVRRVREDASSTRSQGEDARRGGRQDDQWGRVVQPQDVLPLEPPSPAYRWAPERARVGAGRDAWTSPTAQGSRALAPIGRIWGWRRTSWGIQVTLKSWWKSWGGRGSSARPFLAPPLVCASSGHRGSGALGSDP